MIILLCVALWLVVGFFCFVFWWTQDYDFTVNEIPTALIVSAGGPLAFFVGLGLHGSGKTIFKKRGKR